MHELVIADLHALEGLEPATAWEVAYDLAERRALGIKRYGTRLQAHNGRDWRVDLYQELMDAVVYARQGKEEDSPGAGALYEWLVPLLLATRSLL